MKPDAVQSLVRLRRLARDEALRELVAALEDAARAEAEVAAIRRKMADEEKSAAETDADDLAVEAFGRWFRRARADLEAAGSVRDRAEAEVARVRALLVAARAALEGAESELRHRQEDERAIAARRDQAALDELARNAPPAEGRG